MILDVRDAILVPLGILAGAMTTLAGLGGGLLLLAALSLAYDPKLALAITAPALMFGNLHRAAIYRSFIDVPIAARVATAGFAGALVFGWVAVRCPDWLLRSLLLASTLFAIGRATKTIELAIRPTWLVPMGWVIGAVTATSGGGPALLAPTLMASGLSGERYISTASTCALCVHLARVIAYGSSGLIDQTGVARSACLTAAVLVGNAIGARLRPRFSTESLSNLELAALCGVALATMSGFGH